MSGISTVFAMLPVLLYPMAELPPPNAAARLEVSQPARFRLIYNGDEIMSAELRPRQNHGVDQQVDCRIESSITSSGNAHTQTIMIVPANADTTSSLLMKARIVASPEAFAAETESATQQRMPLVRTSVGHPFNARNNAIYDRRFDWVLSGPPDQCEIVRHKDGSFDFQTSGQTIELLFRPRYYGRHKNIRFFEPWTYRIWSHSVCGWCSWWAYQNKLSLHEVREISELFDEHLVDYGFEYVQIDDGYQADQQCLPTSWLNTNERFPGGLSNIVQTITSHRLKPGLWVSCDFRDKRTVSMHPDWFAQDSTGQPLESKWVGSAIDGTNETALDELIRPTFRALKEMGWAYVKVDSLRHLLYDGYYPCRSTFQNKQTTPEQAFRNLLAAIRKELGSDIYLLSCWGVLPESAGIADACRLGSDGFGPASLSQYNSWNNVVWRNDPDHADISPEGQHIIRPVITSMAGAQLMLSDKVEVYRDTSILEGCRRSAPILFSQPGQLYDFDSSKSLAVEQGRRNMHGGHGHGPTDADWFTDHMSQWWQQDIARPFGSWTVLARLDWNPLPPTSVSLIDLGLPAGAPYIVHEFWSDSTLGVFDTTFPASAQDALAVRVYAIRSVLDRPQVISTNRHISQGGVDLYDIQWNAETRELAGTSKVVGNDPYQLVIHLPAPYRLDGVRLDPNLEAHVAQKSNHGLQIARIRWTSPTSGKINWCVTFSK